MHFTVAGEEPRPPIAGEPLLPQPFPSVEPIPVPEVDIYEDERPETFMDHVRDNRTVINTFFAGG